MQKSVFVLFIVFCCLIGIASASYYHRLTNQIYSQTKPTTQVPVTLDIPAIHIHAHIESVGLDSHQQMDVPKDTQDVAWYKLGSQPGSQGNAVIDGHVDTPTSAPAVFARLKDIKSGDTIDVTEQQHITHEFVVTSVEHFSTPTFPANRVFGSISGAHLNLITCDGVWDNNMSNYSQRLVVFSKLVK